MHTCCTCLILNATSTHSHSICPSIRPRLLISALFMHLPSVLWAWICAPATHFFGRTDPYYTVIFYTSYGLNKRSAATLAFPLSVHSVLSSQYLFQRGPIWIAGWSRKESDIVLLNDADFYLWRHYIELYRSLRWLKREKCVSHGSRGLYVPRL